MAQPGNRKRWLNAVLIVLLMVVWGFVVRIIVRSFAAGNAETRSPQGLKVQASDPMDTLGLTLDYPDPFLWVYQTAPKPERKGSAGTSATTVALQQARSQYSASQSGIRARVQVKWPSIAYHGILRRSSSTQVMAMFTIDGQAVTCPLGMERGGVRIVTAYPDSAMVEYAGESRIIKLSTP